MNSSKLTDQQWRKKLSSEQFNICRCSATEPPFTGQYTNCKDDGIYHCLCCGQTLFDAKTKYDSGSGWPSFFAPVSANAVQELTDDSLGMRRVEVTCRRCDAHLGHVFEDGPQPTGLRYCINSTSLNLKPR